MSRDERREDLNRKTIIIFSIFMMIFFLTLVIYGIHRSRRSDYIEEETTTVHHSIDIEGIAEVNVAPPEAETEEQSPPTEFETDYNISYGEEETTKDYSSLVIGTRYILGDGVRVREGPGTDYPVHTMMLKYASVQITDENSEWTEVYMDGDIYYILGKYCGTEEEMKAYKEEEEVKKRSAYYYAFQSATSDDLKLLAKILALEAEDEPWLGKVAVVEVVMNRVISRNPQFPDTITGVLKQKGQFETVKYLSNPYNTPTDEDWSVINYVIENGPTAIRQILDDNGITDINSLNYVYFATYKANGTGFVKYGNHYFSRNKKDKYWFSK